MSTGVWATAWRRLRQDRVGWGALWIVALYGVLIALTASGLLAADWQREKGASYAPPAWLDTEGARTTPGTTTGPATNVAPSLDEATHDPHFLDLRPVDPLASRYADWAHRTAELPDDATQHPQALPMGGDRFGRDVLAKALQGSRISITVGLLAAVVAAALGTLLGALSGFLGGRVGDALEWLYNVFTSIPGILLIFAFAAVTGRGVGSVVLILGLTGWTGIYRLVRAEFMKHAERDYVLAARSFGAGRAHLMFRQILPNVSHVVLVQLSTHVVGFIKYEVILSYLGLGVSIDQVSWGTMLAESQSELLLGHWWQLATATVLMAGFVTAFSLLTDALRDALDPKLRGLES